MVDKNFIGLDKPDITRFESYLPTAFSSELTLLQKVNKIIQDLNRNFDLTNEMVDYLNRFIEMFDEKLYLTVEDILSKWLEDGILTELIRDVINEEVVEARDGETKLNIRLNRDKQSTDNQIEQLKDKDNELTTQLAQITLNIKKFGAVGDGVTDDSQAIQEAVDYALENKIVTVFFPDGQYYLDRPVYINTSKNIAIRFKGTSSASYVTYNPGGSTISGAPGMESLFIITKDDLQRYGGYAFTSENISYVGGQLGTTGAKTAIKNIVGGSPARPFTILNNNFTGFDKAIVSDISKTGLTTGICNVSIKYNNFINNKHSLYGKGQGAIMLLDFSNNVSEQGGKLLTEPNALIGPYKITDNLLEGQEDAIVLGTGKSNGEISRNYFELNTGYLLKVISQNTQSTLTLGKNYYHNTKEAKIKITNVELNCLDNFKVSNIPFAVKSLQANSKINNQGILNGDFDELNSPSFFDFNSIPTFSSIFEEVEGGFVGINSTNVGKTPLGEINIRPTSGFSPLMPMIGQSVASGDYVVAISMIRRTSQTYPNIGCMLYNDENLPLGNSEVNIFRGTSIGEWSFVIGMVKAQTSSINPKVRWQVSDGSVDLGATYAYKLENPESFKTEMFYGFPPLP